MLSGEPLAVEKSAGDPVSGATINGEGSFVMLAERVGKETHLAQITDAVMAAMRSRTPLQGLADRVSAILVPLVIALSALSFLGWGLFAHNWPDGILAAVSVLVYACPCALGLATPMSLAVGMGESAKLGLLFKDAASMEALAEVDTLLLDKTGTLSEAKPTMLAMEALPGFERENLLRLAASLEKASGHPLAKAFVAAWGGPLEAYSELQAKPGLGIQGRIDGKRVCLGKREYVGWKEEVLELKAKAFEEDAASMVFMSVEGQAAGFFAVRDKLKDSAAQAVIDLKKLGLELCLLSGDQAGAVSRTAKELDIADFHAGLSPQGKFEFLKELRTRGRRIAMLGDGINDAPALAAAEVGIAVGGAADVALESARAVLLHPELQNLAKGIALARRVRANLRQNLAWAFVYNLLGLPLAAGLFYPSFHIFLPPMLAGASMSMSSLSVILNSLRLKGSAR
jgi:Cu+-exporting ATPase